MKQWWKTEPWRMLQTNMRETDMSKLNAKEYVRQFKDFKANIAVISIGGILANYPSKVEDHTINKELTGDSLEEVINACHEAGIRVMGRVDFSKIRTAVYEKHPDWAYKTAEGNIVDYNGNIHACLCGGFQQIKSFEIMEEILNTFPVDGIFINMGGFQVVDYSYNYYGICHCESCKERFMEMFGLDLPEKEDMSSPIFRKYVIFKDRIVKDYAERMKKLIHDINPNVALEGYDFRRVESNTEYKVRRTPQRQYGSSSIVRGFQSLPTGIPCTNPSVDFIGYFYRHVAVSPDMQSLREIQTLANYGLLDYYIMGLIEDHEDRSGFEPVKEVFHFHSKHEEVYRDMKLYGGALLVRKGGYSPSMEGNGWVRAFTESHILFHETEPEFLTPELDLSQYRVIVLADVHTISDDLVAKMDEYVAEGGHLIVVGQTGIYSDNGDQRESLPFECIGAVGSYELRTDMVSAMLKITPDEKKWLPEMSKTDLLYIGDDYMVTSYKEDVKKHLPLIPPHTYGPPEICYYTHISEEPGMTSRIYGKGKAVYIPWYPGLLYSRDGYSNTFGFMKGLLTEFAGLPTVEDEPFSPMVEVTLGFEKTGSHSMVHLINATGHFGISFLPPVPIYDIKLCIPMPKQPREVVSLVSDNEIPFRWKDGMLYLKIDRLDKFEVVFIKLK